MNKILIFIIAIAMSVAHAGAAVRDGTNSRNQTQKRISTSTPERTATNARTSILGPVRTVSVRSSNTDSTTERNQSNIINRPGSKSLSDPQATNISARVTTNAGLATETRTGAAYEICKSAFFTCMDQFCALKNDDYRRCSCSNRIIDLAEQRATLNDVGQQLTVFTENLDVVGLNAAQATAMRTASEGESALSTDTSASKALLQAIMNSISGGDTTVGGKYSNLNTINMSYDLSTVFSTDANQLIASYDGKNLYTAVYPQCRHAVSDDCNNASLQRAVNAYLMAIEQDCNTVQTAINERRSQMKSAIREGSAMLDLARVENRRKHNSDDVATCINNVESAILSEEVCGANYHKCLDNGEFIDVATGAPIIGVKNFADLSKLLTFQSGVDAANQRLSKLPNNRLFVSNFEKRTKMFAEPALDKCTEIADEVWSEYLDRALLAIYYAQQSKVDEIKQGCFDFISGCYADKDGSITAAMAELMGTGLDLLQPNKITLTNKMCTDYVDSCNKLFDENIIEDYVNKRKDTDVLDACRTVVKQCFDKYGGVGYENFYYPYSGLFQSGKQDANKMTAGDWFTLYDLSDSSSTTKSYKSPCAIQLTKIDACNTTDVIEQAFGGFDRMYTNQNLNKDQLSFAVSESNTGTIRYGIADESGTTMRHRILRSVGVATEIYNQIVDTLNIQCNNINGRFVERQFVKENLYGGPNSDQPNICLWYPQQPESDASEVQQNQYNNYTRIATMYGIDSAKGENMCPRDYNLNVDSYFWGACLCWENGARRSRNGKNATCVAELPITGDTEICYATDGTQQYSAQSTGATQNAKWCTQSINTAGQVCPFDYIAKETDTDIVCRNSNDESISPEILKLIPKTTY